MCWVVGLLLGCVFYCYCITVLLVLVFSVVICLVVLWVLVLGVWLLAVVIVWFLMSWRLVGLVELCCFGLDSFGVLLMAWWVGLGGVGLLLLNSVVDMLRLFVLMIVGFMFGLQIVVNCCYGWCC